MAIVQQIKFNSTNGYFAGFLQSLIDESGITGAVEFNNGEIVLTLDDKDTKGLENFSELSSKYLPHSIFLGEIKTTSQDIKISEKKYKSDAYNLAPCPKCLELISDPSSSNYLDDSLVCNHYANEDTLVESDIIHFTPHYTKGCSVLVCDSSKIDDLFIMTQKEKEVLFSIEKPTIKVTVKDEELKSLTNKNYINVKASYNIRSTLTALNAKDSEIPYIFFKENHDLKVIKVQENLSIITASRIATNLINLDEDSVLNRFLNITNETKFEDAIGVNLSYTNSISFIVKNELATKKAIIFQEFNQKDVLSMMQEDEIRSKLLENFKVKFSSAYDKLMEGKSSNIFEILCDVLELQERSFESLSDKALEFRGNGGLKIDLEFDHDKFDYSAFIGSVISFKLAGAETHYIAYSIFEAYGDMAISTLNQLKAKFKINNIVMMGNMFENSILYSRILSKYQLAKPYFSKSIALDD